MLLLAILWTIGSLASIAAVLLAAFDLRLIRRDERELRDVENRLAPDREDGTICPDCGFVVIGGLCCRPGRERRAQKALEELRTRWNR